MRNAKMLLLLATALSGGVSGELVLPTVMV